MHAAWIIAQRQFKRYFISPVAYATAAFMFLILGGIFSLNIYLGLPSGQITPDGRMVLQPLVLILVFVTPAITMRLLGLGLGLAGCGVDGLRHAGSRPGGVGVVFQFGGGLLRRPVHAAGPVDHRRPGERGGPDQPGGRLSGSHGSLLQQPVSRHSGSQRYSVLPQPDWAGSVPRHPDRRKPPMA